MNNNIDIKKSLTIALMAAVISVLSPISMSIPISPVPISLSTFVIYLTANILGGINAAFSTIIYVLLGIVGVPVFTGFTGGVAKVLGPTGGYIISYVFLAIISGCIIEKNQNNIIMCFVGMILGTIVLYIVGTLWLAHVAGMTFDKALLAGVIPFIPGDIIKMILAYILGRNIKRILSRGGFI